MGSLARRSINRTLSKAHAIDWAGRHIVRVRTVLPPRA
jgi:hypothetical protein